MKNILAIFLTVGFAVPCFSEIINLRSGKDITETVSSIDDNYVIFKNGRKIPREEISMIQFSTQKAAAPDVGAIAIEPTAKDKKQARALFRQAGKFGKKYPGTDGLILVDDGEYIYKKDGTRTVRFRFAGIILKDGVKKEWGDVITYEQKGRSTSKIVKATVYTPDGKIYPLDPSKIKKTEPQSAEKFFSAGGFYLTYALPNVEVGSIIDYVVETQTYNPYEKDFFFPQWSFQGRFPVKWSRIKITVPKGQELYYSTRNFKDKYAKFAKPKITKTRKTVTYLWKLEDQSPVIAEPLMVPYGDIVLSLRASLFKGWDRIYDWTNELYLKRVNANEELKNFTLDLIKDSKTDEEKTAEIYHYVQKEIRYIAIKLGIASGMGGYDANLTWKRRWGCCVDKAILLTAMLNVAGIKSSIIDLRTNDRTKIDFTVPSLYFNHAISVVELGGKKIYLDSTNFDYRFPTMASFNHGVSVLNIFDRTIDHIPLPAPSDNSSHYNFTIDVAPNGDTVVSETLNYTGPREAELKGYYRSIKKEEQKLVFQRMIKDVSPAAELIEHKINNTDVIEKPFSMSMKYRIKDYPIKAGDILIFKIPDLEMDAAEINEVSLKERKYPMEYTISMGKYYHYEINIPENYKIISLLEDIELKNKHASFKAGCIEIKKGRIVCEASRERTSRLIPVEDYQEYKSFLEKMVSYTKNRIFFKLGT